MRSVRSGVRPTNVTGRSAVERDLVFHDRRCASNVQAQRKEAVASLFDKLWWAFFGKGGGVVSRLKFGLEGWFALALLVECVFLVGSTIVGQNNKPLGWQGAHQSGVEGYVMQAMALFFLVTTLICGWCNRSNPRLKWNAGRVECITSSLKLLVVAEAYAMCICMGLAFGGILILAAMQVAFTW